MINNHEYETWRNKLLAEVSKNYCTPCDDERKKQYNLDYNNPLNCECRCDRVNHILEHASNILI